MVSSRSTNLCSPSSAVPLQPDTIRGLNSDTGEFERKCADELGVCQSPPKCERARAGGQAQSKPSAARQGTNRQALAGERGLVDLVFRVEGYPARCPSYCSSSRRSCAAQSICNVWRNPPPICVQSKGSERKSISCLQEKAPESQMLEGLTYP